MNEYIEKAKITTETQEALAYATIALAESQERQTEAIEKLLELQRNTFSLLSDVLDLGLKMTGYKRK